jgi:hypothetical protein
MARRARIRGGTLVVSVSVAALAAYVRGPLRLHGVQPSLQVSKRRVGLLVFGLTLAVTVTTPLSAAGPSGAAERTLHGTAALRQGVTAIGPNGFQFSVEATAPYLVTQFPGEFQSVTAPPGSDYVAIDFTLTNLQQDRSASTIEMPQLVTAVPQDQLADYGQSFCSTLGTSSLCVVGIPGRNAIINDGQGNVVGVGDPFSPYSVDVPPGGSVSLTFHFGPVPAAEDLTQIQLLAGTQCDQTNTCSGPPLQIPLPAVQQSPPGATPPGSVNTPPGSANTPPAIPPPIVSSGAAPPNRPVAITAPVSVVVFVHGIRSGCDEPGSSSDLGSKSYNRLFDALVNNNLSVYSFCYDHDKAFSRNNWDKTDCFSPTTSHGPAKQLKVSFDDKTGPLYQSQAPNDAKNITTFEGNSAYDTDGPLAYDATKLNDCLSGLVKARASGANNIALIVNSMGGAIGRGWLALAPEVNSLALTKVTTFITLEGAMEGSYVARIGQNIAAGLASIPLVGPSIANNVESVAGQAGDLNPMRPGVKDLDPQSGWYRSLVANGEPPKLHYYTFSTDLVFNITIPEVSSKSFPTDPFGDGVMELGSAASYQTQPPLGGSSFLPGGSGVDKHQYIMTSNYYYTLNVNSTVPFVGAVLDATSEAGLQTTYINAILNDPFGHFSFGSLIGTKKQPPITSCDASHAQVSIPKEIVRILGKPAAACSSS